MILRHSEDALFQADEEIKKLYDAIRSAGFVVCQTSGEWTLHDVTEQGKVEQERCLEVANKNVDLEIENTWLKAELAISRQRCLRLAEKLQKEKRE